jgi:hypothetical protein
MVRPEMVDRLLRPVFIDPLPAHARRRFDDLMAMAALFAGAVPFPSSIDSIRGGPAAPTLETLEAAFAASLTHLAYVKGWVSERATVAA